MAEIEVAPLANRLADEDITRLASALAEAGAPRLREGDEGAARTIADEVDGDLIAEFLDRLEAFDLACDIYLPLEFDSRVEVGEIRIGSAQSLIDVLEEMKDELDIEREGDSDESSEDGEEEEDKGYDLIRGQLRQLWKLLYTGAQTSMERKLPLHVRV